MTWSNRHVLREVDHHRARWLWSLLLGFALAAVPSAMCLLQQNRCLELTYQIAALRSEQEQLLESQRRLRARLASMQSLESIEAWAKTSGLVRPRSDESVVVRRASEPRTEMLARDSRNRRPEPTLRR